MATEKYTRGDGQPQTGSPPPAKKVTWKAQGSTEPSASSKGGRRASGRAKNGAPSPAVQKDAAVSHPQGRGGYRKQYEEMKKTKRAKRSSIIIAILIPIFAGILGFSLWQIFSIQKEYNVGVDEYDMLRQQVLGGESGGGTAGVLSATAAEETALSLESIIALNPECFGWLEVPDTPISYPLVQGPNNEKYLHHTFLGNANSAGAIFIDYRNSTSLQDEHTILYGHNMKNGSMFGPLSQFLNDAYRQEHATVLLRDMDNLYTYQIFATRVGDMYDPSYQVEFGSEEQFEAFAKGLGAPDDTTQILTLSTCTNINDDERILAHAALVSVEPVA